MAIEIVQNNGFRATCRNCNAVMSYQWTDLHRDEHGDGAHIECPQCNATIYHANRDW